MANGEIGLGLVNGLQLKKQTSKQTNLSPVTIHPTKPYPTLESALLTNFMIYLEAVRFNLPLKNASFQHYTPRELKKKKKKQVTTQHCFFFNVLFI